MSDAHSEDDAPQKPPKIQPQKIQEGAIPEIIETPQKLDHYGQILRNKNQQLSQDNETLREENLRLARELENVNFQKLSIENELKITKQLQIQVDEERQLIHIATELLSRRMASGNSTFDSDGYDEKHAQYAVFLAREIVKAAKTK